MTFYEAALRILESAGQPLHFQEITERSIAESLLSHIGKTPDQTMLSRLAAMAKRKGGRRVMVTAKDTFGLVEWQLPEDAEALQATGVPEPHPEEGLPPLRPEERHPEPHQENVRAAGRGAERGKRRRGEDEERGKRRRYPPVPEVVFEILSESREPLAPDAILEQARELGLASQELAVESLLTALLEDNQKRIDAGRRPQFLYTDSGQVSLERAGAPSEAPSLELQAAFAAALGIPLEGGRPVLSKATPAGEVAEDAAIQAAARQAIKDARKAMARAFRRRLQAMEPGAFERAAFKLLHGQDFRELKVAKRGKEGPLLTARRKEGSVELRFAIRLHRGNSVDRKLVQELRKDLGHYSAQVGLLIAAGDLRGDARSEAQTSGSLVMLWCGDALAEKFFEAHTGVKVVQLELFEADEAFFAQMDVEAEEARKRREERLKDREDRPAREGEERPRREREERPGRDRGPKAERPPRDAEQVPAEAAKAADVERAEPGEATEGDADLEAAAAFVGGQAEESKESKEEAGERKRRRRRRRGRRGRGPKDGEAAEAGANGEADEGSDEEGDEEAGEGGPPETAVAGAGEPSEAAAELAGERVAMPAGAPGPAVESAPESEAAATATPPTIPPPPIEEDEPELISDADVVAIDEPAAPSRETIAAAAAPDATGPAPVGAEAPIPEATPADEPRSDGDERSE